MEFLFDPDKDAANRRKHGVSLLFGAKVLAHRVTQFLDTRHDYGEDRFICFGYVDARLYVCIYTVRADAVRLISVRKANDREVEQYG